MNKKNIRWIKFVVTLCLSVTLCNQLMAFGILPASNKDLNSDRVCAAADYDDPMSYETRNENLKEKSSLFRMAENKGEGDLKMANAVAGIDVSYHQGNIDWQAVKNAGINFAIIRCGYRGSKTGGLYEDSQFRANIQGANAAGIKVGVYFYSLAKNEQQAIEEANYTLSLISGYKVTYPVYIDYEDSSLGNIGKDQKTSICKAFCDRVYQAGYTAGVYTYYYWATSQFNMNALSDYSIWLARYRSTLGYDGKYDLWQYSSEGNVPGIYGNVDVDYSYTDYDNTGSESIKLNAANITYETHVQDIGWEANWRVNGATSGTTGQGKRLEAIKINLTNQEYSGGIEYRTHIQDIGWELGWKSNGQMSGTSGQSKRLEAIQIHLTGDMANQYDVYYRVHAQNYGWLDWAVNGQSAGTAGYSYRLEAIQIKLVKKGEAAPGSTAIPYRQTKVQYHTHVQDYGWQGYVVDGAVAGTTGQSKRLEGIQITLPNQEYSGAIQYRTHIQNIGWESSWKSNGEMSGTSGRSLRLEAIQIQLTGDMASHYDVYYQVHAQNYGWLGWAKNGESAGTAGHSLRLEGIRIVLVSKGGAAPGSTNGAFVN